MKNHVITIFLFLLLISLNFPVRKVESQVLPNCLNSQCKPFSCLVRISTNTTTQCQSAPATNSGLRNYILTYQIFNTSSGVSNTFSITTGKGTNCNTNSSTLTPTYSGTSPAAINTPGIIVNFTGDGILSPAAQAICVNQTAITTPSTAIVTISGIIAP